MTHHRLVLGTRNRHKAGELSDLLAPYGLAVCTLADLSHSLEIEETGDSFAANAALKARLQARHLGLWVLGEDSGLCVEALGGAPGVLSARFSGPDATDESNNRRLLERLAGVPLDQRGARYTCHMTLADPAGRVRADCQADCRGRIGEQPRGQAGFGYDPLFEVVEYHQTLGQLGEAVKSVLSHRARAFRRLLPKIRQLIASGEWASS